MKQWPYAKRVVSDHGMTPLECAKKPRDGEEPNAAVVALLKATQDLEDANPFPW